MFDRRRRLCRALSAGLCLGLTACAAFVPQGRTDCTAESLLKDAGRLASLSPQRLGDEYAGAKRLFLQTGAACDRLQLALVAVTSATPADDAEALGLLEDYLARSPGRDALGGLATLLLHSLEARVYEEARVQAAQREVADEKAKAAAREGQLGAQLSAERSGAEAARRQASEEKARAEALRRQLGDERARLDALRRLLADEQARTETYRRQLDGLKEIDKILREREKP